MNTLEYIILSAITAIALVFAINAIWLAWEKRGKRGE